MLSKGLQQIMHFQQEKIKTEEALYGSPHYLVWEFNLQRMAQGRFIFVEGQSDEKFYRNVINEFKTACFMFGKKTEDEEVGKKAVVISMIQIAGKSEFKKDFTKCTFILDRDYDPRLEMTGYTITDSEREKVLLTAGHSVENYLLYKENWKIFIDSVRAIYPDIALDDNELNKSLLSFSKKYAKFFIQKATIIKGIEYFDKPPYSNGSSHDDIFLYSFPNDIVNEILLKKEMRKMENYISENDLDDVYDNYKKTILTNPLLYIRGHDIYDYIRGYIIFNCKINIGSFLDDEIIKVIKDKIEIHFDIPQC